LRSAMVVEERKIAVNIPHLQSSGHNGTKMKSMPETPPNPKTFHLHPGDAIGFDDAGELAAITWPDCHEPPEVELLGRLKEVGAMFPDEAAALTVIRASVAQHDVPDHGQQIILKLIARIASGRNAKQAGQFVFVLAHKLSLPGFRTQTELASKMGVTQGRAS